MSVKKPPFLAKSFECACSNQCKASEGRFKKTGKCRLRISCGHPASHRSALPVRFCHEEDGRVLADPAAALPVAAVCKKSQKKVKKMTFAPASPQQDFNSRREYMTLSCSLHEARVQPERAAGSQCCMGCRACETNSPGYKLQKGGLQLSHSLGAALSSSEDRMLTRTLQSCWGLRGPLSPKASGTGD